MNAFYEHHKSNIRFSYRCFDRILLNGLIQPFQQPERAVGFFSTYRAPTLVGCSFWRAVQRSTNSCVRKQLVRRAKLSHTGFDDA